MLLRNFVRQKKAQKHCFFNPLYYGENEKKRSITIGTQNGGKKTSTISGIEVYPIISKIGFKNHENQSAKIKNLILLVCREC